MEAFADHFMALVDVWQGEPERPLEHLPRAPRTHPEARRRRSPCHGCYSRSRSPSSPPAGPSRPATGSRAWWRWSRGATPAYDVGALPARRGAAPAGGRRRPRPRRCEAQASAERTRQSPVRDAAALTLGRLAAARGEWRSPSSTRSRTSTPASRAATRPTSRPAWTRSQRSRRASAPTRTRCGCSPPPSAPGPRSASSACRPRSEHWAAIDAGFARRSATTPTRRRALRALS